ncbi:MAG: DUF1294 domain-containing protein [Streptococcaceae bacterium]|jgi:uncharacterized membrane protein YsdA (DUF1294 family)|nr:DUF1294 domain-containing protein [Streptococcaceae bacterium]
MSGQTYLIGLLFGWNLVVFGLYAVDKSRAKRGKWRISERTLLLSAVLFGGLGALLSGHLFHHKTRKLYFQIVWWLGVLIDGVVIFALLK